MTKRKPKELHLQVGRPSGFKPEYCDLLINHMKDGGSIESFACKIPCAISTIYYWLDSFPEFSEARKTGMGYLHNYYEAMAKTIAAGQLRRIKSERPMLDKKGQPLLDPRTGQPMYKREYEPTNGGQAVFIFLTKNMLKWRDRHDIELSGKDGGPMNFSNMTDAELNKKVEELVQKAKKK